MDDMIGEWIIQMLLCINSRQLAYDLAMCVRLYSFIYTLSYEL